MLGLLVIIVISWGLLYFIEKEHIPVLGIVPNPNRIFQFFLGTIVITLLLLLNIYIQTQLESIEWKKHTVNYTLLWNAVVYHLRSALTEDLVFRGAILYILIKRIGSNKAIPIDIRLICATNESPQALADEKKFRKDLIYRINTVDITVPPLRERDSDILLLAKYFVSIYEDKYNKGPFDFDAGFVKKLKSHDFPGNVRELQYILERAVIMTDGYELKAEDLVFSTIERSVQTTAPQTTNLDDLEKNTILAVLEKNKGNISKSAKELGITRAALYRRMDKYEL